MCTILRTLTIVCNERVRKKIEFVRQKDNIRQLFVTREI